MEKVILKSRLKELLKELGASSPIWKRGLWPLSQEQIDSVYPEMAVKASVIISGKEVFIGIWPGELSDKAGYSVLAIMIEEKYTRASFWVRSSANVWEEVEVFR